MTDQPTPCDAAPRRIEVLFLALVLVAAFRAIPDWAFAFLPRRRLYESLGRHGFATLYDAASTAMPLLLCLGAPRRSGLVPFEFTGNRATMGWLFAAPVLLTVVVYPFTSQPYTGDRIGCWLISPLAQDLLFPGYILGLFASVFPVTTSKRGGIDRASILMAGYFSLWHVPNIVGLPMTYLIFQLLYTAVFGLLLAAARRLTNGIYFGLAIHMTVNFVAWRGW